MLTISDIFYIGEKVGLLQSTDVAGKPMYFISGHSDVEDVLVFVEALLYEYEEIRAIKDMLDDYES